MALVVWAGAMVLGLSAGAPLTHDEAAYAVRARDGAAVWTYRPVGMLGFGWVGLWLGGSDAAMRVASALSSGLVILAVAAVGNRFSAWTGAWAAAVVAGSHAFALRGFQLLTDVPSTTLVLAAVAIAIDELDGGRPPRYRLVLIAPLLVAAIYVRYGAIATVGVFVIAGLVVFRRAIAARPGPVIATAAVGVVLMVPLLVYSARVTGGVLGLFVTAGQVAGQPLGSGLVRMLTVNPFIAYGVVLAPVAVLGAIGIGAAGRSRFVAAIAIGQIVVLGAIGAGDPRFVFVALALLCVRGVDLVRRALPDRLHDRLRDRLPRRLHRWAAVAVALAAVGTLTAMRPVERQRARALGEIVEAANAIRRDAAGRRCHVVAGAVPHLRWYTGCEVSREGEVPAGARGYVVSTGRHPRGGVDGARIAPGVWRRR